MPTIYVITTIGIDSSNNCSTTTYIFDNYDEALVEYTRIASCKNYDACYDDDDDDSESQKIIKIKVSNNKYSQYRYHNGDWKIVCEYATDSNDDFEVIKEVGSWKCRTFCEIRKCHSENGKFIIDHQDFNSRF